MLTSLLLGYIVEIIVFISNFLPNTSLVPASAMGSIYSAINFFFSLLHNLDTVLPMATLFQVAGIMIATEIAIMIFNLFVFIYKRIRG